MLLTINGPLQHFWQWDADRTLIVHEETCSEVHFSNGTEECAPVCDVYEHSGLRLVNVPNIFLQEDRPLVAYLYRKGSDGQLTRCQQVFHILSRPKPDDYVYTETELKRWDDLDERIRALEQGGGGTVKPEDAEWTATKELVGGDTVYIPEQKVSNGIWSKLQRSLQPGLTYDVTFNGEVYSCVARASGSYGGVVLGNSTGLTLNDYPFCIMWGGGTATSGMFFKRDNISNPVTLKVTDHPHYEYNQLPEGYLPDCVVKSVNGIAPDENGNVQIDATGGGTGEPEADGEDGGYYTPTVTQTGENTIKFSFTASKEGMAAVADQSIMLPTGKDGKTAYQYAQEAGYTGTEAEFAEKLAKESGDTVTDEQIAAAVEEYMNDHPVTGGGLSITDDNNGNVTIASTGSVSITDDGFGNVVIA